MEKPEKIIAVDYLQRKSMMQLLLNYYEWFDDNLQKRLAASGEEGFSKAQSTVFMNLAEGRNTAVDIARHLGVSKQAVNKTVNELVDRGYLRLIVDEQDKRVKRIEPTAAGLEKGRQATEALLELEKELEQKMGSSAFQSLRKTLENPLN